MAGSIREALAEAWGDIEKTPEGEKPTRSLETIVDDTNTDLAPLEGATDTSTADQPLEEIEEATTTPPPKKQVRPEIDGNKAPPVTKVKPEVDGNKVPVTKTKAPQSWRPEMRAEWDKIPATVQAEIAKREGEISRGLAEAASARRFSQEFTNVVRPFEALIRGSGVNPLKAVENLMTTAATLQTGTQAQRANTVANIIKAYGVDIATLDAVLAGRQPKPGSQPNEELIGTIQRELAPVREFMTTQQRQVQQQQEQLQQESMQTIEQFANDPENEYYEDLREDMADLLDMAAQRGRVMTIKEAYDRAAAVHPEISKLVAKKRAAAAALNSRGKLDRARRAAASQSSGTPASLGGTGSAKPKGVRAAVSQAWDDLSAQ